MLEDFWIAVLILIGFAIYVTTKVIAYMRESEAQWNQVDRTKLKEWEEDEDD